MENKDDKLNELAKYIDEKLKVLSEFRAYKELESICEENGILLMDLNEEDEEEIN